MSQVLKKRNVRFTLGDVVEFTSHGRAGKKVTKVGTIAVVIPAGKPRDPYRLPSWEYDHFGWMQNPPPRARESYFVVVQTDKKPRVYHPFNSQLRKTHGIL